MAGKLLLGLLLCGGVAAKPLICKMLIVQGDTSLTAFLETADISPPAIAENTMPPVGSAARIRGEHEGYFEGFTTHPRCNPGNFPTMKGLHSDECKVENAANLLQPKDGNGGTFNLQFPPIDPAEDPAEQATMNAWHLQNTANSLVRWYKKVILEMVKEDEDPDENRAPLCPFVCKLTEIVVRQTGKMREELLKPERESDKKAWVKAMKLSLKVLATQGDLTFVYPSRLDRFTPSSDFALFSTAEQDALPAGAFEKDKIAVKAKNGLEATRYLVSKNLHFSLLSKVKAKFKATKANFKESMAKWKTSKKTKELL